MNKVMAVLIGAGERGMNAYASYALENPNEIEFVAVAEPNEERRKHFQRLHSISDENCFQSWNELLDKPRLADAALICTQDRMHFEPTMKALEQGYHVLLEKPMSTTPQECVAMGECAKKYDRVFAICHVLRYTNFFSTLKMLLDENRIGRLISIQHNENVGYWHYAHSYVRGNWRKVSESSPMILAKSCHDMDIMLWLAGADCESVASFGSLTHFKKENAPFGAAKRCLDNCGAAKECPYYAPALYLTDNTGWPTSVISDDTSMEARVKALENGPYGRCVYSCDNDVVDHQVVSIRFENEVTASFSMTAFTNETCRTIKLMGTKGEIRGVMEKNEIEISNFSTGRKDVICLKDSKYGHGGGDYGIMSDFIKYVTKGRFHNTLTSAEVSVQSHIMAFAAEEARLSGKVVNIKSYMNGLRSIAE